MAPNLPDGNRYLSLTGVFMTLEHAAASLVPAFEELKRRYFGRDPDERVVLHRSEIVRAKAPFLALADPGVRQRFNADLLNLLERLQYGVITAVIDKASLHRQYGPRAYHPYHYAMKTLLERYVLELRDRHTKGDVMAESRGGKEDLELKEAFERISSAGTQYVKRADMDLHLSSRQLKLKKKTADVAGLQLADLIAYPSQKSMHRDRSGEAPPADFNSKVASILKRTRYRRSYSGRIDGWGTVWLD